MSNASIASRVLEVVAAFERGEAGATAIAESIELHEPALEAIPREVRDSLQSLSVEVVRQDFSPFELEQLGIPENREALNQLKGILQSIEKT